jgi:hypothetical protein
MDQYSSKTFAVAVMAFLSGCATPVQQSASAGPTSSQPTAATGEQYDMAKGALPGLTYPSLSLGQIINKIEALGGPQKEFETDQAFSQRMGALGPFTVCSEIVKPHVRFNSATGEAAFEYLLIGVPYWSDFEGPRSGSEVYPSTRIGQKVTDLGVSEGQNAYGAKAKFSTHQLDNVYIVMNPVPRLSLTDYISPKFVGRAKQQLLDDLQASKKIEMCFESVPVKPYVRYDYGGKKPTLDDPTATLATTRNVRVAVTRFYIKGDRPQAAYVEDLRFSRR